MGKLSRTLSIPVTIASIVPFEVPGPGELDVVSGMYHLGLHLRYIAFFSAPVNKSITVDMTAPTKYFGVLQILTRDQEVGGSILSSLKNKSLAGISQKSWCTSR
jgi:hypothetical protein